MAPLLLPAGVGSVEKKLFSLPSSAIVRQFVLPPYGEVLAFAHGERIRHTDS